MRHSKLILSALLATLVAACAADEPPPPAGAQDGSQDLPLGDVQGDDLKADGGWGYALTCKTGPDLPQLVDPHITISLQGLTLHLTDPATGFDKTFPVGVGQINQNTRESSYGESLSYYPIIATGGNDFAIRSSGIDPCKFWWTDPDTGHKSPVFAGLPFMSWYGNYGIHGPIDNFRAANGGSLRRGFVSHGCIRMEAADVLEVYARIKGIAKVPVHVQREPERTATGSRVDVDPRWVGAECDSDSDCNFDGGFCHANRYSERGFCSMHCSRYCADRAGYPSTFCVADPDQAGQGMCVSKVQKENFECRPYDHMVAAAAQPRFSMPSVKANVCLPGSPGWVGDHCFSDADCDNGTTCAGAAADAPGICTESCQRYCPDEPGFAETFCVHVPELGSGGTCLRQCTPGSNASECPADSTCTPLPRNGLSSPIRSVCVPG